MDSERHEILFRHYEAENLDFSYTLGINLSSKDISETFGEGYTTYTLNLEPNSKFKGSKRGVALGRGYFDINLLVDQPISGSIEDLVGEGKPFGRIYFEKKGWGKNTRYRWFYKHEVNLPKESETGLSLFVNGHLMDVDIAVPLEPGKPLDLKLRLKSSGELVHLATIQLT